MPVKITIPTALRQYVNLEWTVEVQGDDIATVFADLIKRFPQLQQHLLDESGAFRRFVNIYLNDEDIRFLQGPNTAVRDGDVISIIPSVSGGSGAGEAEFSRAELERYSRHLIMPEIGLEGQRKLKQARVLLVGAGGLGSPAALYLAAAGVGTLGLVDFDTVDVSNLQRQILFGADDVGKPKLTVAKARLHGINPHIQIKLHDLRLSSENALAVFADYDIIVDGTDNFPTRYLVNDACVLSGKPNVYGSIFRFEGQVSVFAAQDGPCYRCLYPKPPPPGLVPSCAEGGVLGILPGAVGTIQATEAVKLITGKGRPLIGRLLLYDALDMSFRELKLQRDPDCPICGENRRIRGLIDYDEFCGVGRAEKAVALPPEFEITVQDLHSRFKSGAKPFLLDVRNPYEQMICNLPDSVLIPLGELVARTTELPADEEIVIYCRSGIRSAKAVQMLREAGFTKLKNLVGGILAWSDEIDPSMPKY